MSHHNVPPNFNNEEIAQRLATAGFHMLNALPATQKTAFQHWRKSDTDFQQQISKYSAREIRNRQHNFGTTAKQVVMGWACVAKR